MENEENKIFIEKFHSEKFGFFDLTQFTDAKIGFSVKKNLNKGDKDNITILAIYIPDRILDKTETALKPLSIHATYGKKTENGGVIMRENPKPTDPIDVYFPDEYYYDIESKEFFKKNKKITAEEILKEVYYKHIISTKLIKGLYVRIKIKFHRTFLKLFFEYISIYFHGVLYLISGNFYSYNPMFNERKRNNEILSSDITSSYEKTKELKLKEQPSKKINFLGYETTSYCIFFYSIFHLYIYFIFINFPNIFSANMIKIFGNSFSILVYVMFSLIIIDKVLPLFLELLIDIFSKLSFDAQYKTIKL